MRGLIKKDLLIVKKNLKMVLMFVIIFCLFSLEGESIFYFVPAFISVIVFMTTFSYDDYNKWDAYAITLPNGRKNVVKSKYIASLIVLSLTIILTCIVVFLTGMINQKISILELKEAIFGAVVAIIFIQSISYPLIFKFGVEKGRIGMGIGIFGISAIFGILFRNTNFKIDPNMLSFFNDYGGFILVTICIAFLLLSFKISEKIYLKKEF